MQRFRDLPRRHAERHPDRGRGERVLRIVSSRERRVRSRPGAVSGPLHLEGRVIRGRRAGASCRGRGPRALRIRMSPCDGPWPQDVSRAGRPRSRSRSRLACPGKRFEQGPLFPRHAVQVSEELQMLAADVRDQCRVSDGRCRTGTRSRRDGSFPAPPPPCRACRSGRTASAARRSGCSGSPACRARGTSCRSTAATISFVVVFPLLPPMASTGMEKRCRCNARKLPQREQRVVHHQDREVPETSAVSTSAATTAATAPRANASATNGAPSNRSPRRATKRLPRAIVRVSVEIPVTGTPTSRSRRRNSRCRTREIPRGEPHRTSRMNFSTSSRSSRCDLTPRIN